MSCLSIRLKEIPNVVESLLDSDGYFYLDLAEDSELSFTKQLTELTELDQMPFDYVISITIPNSPKNMTVLAKYVQPSDEPKLTPCEVLSGSTMYSNVNIIAKNINSKDITLDILLDSRLWAKKLSKTYVKDLKGYPITTTDPYLVMESDDSIRTSYKYVDGKRQTYTPLVDYGDLRNVTNPVSYDVAKINKESEEFRLCDNFEILTNTIEPYNRVRIFVDKDKLIFMALDGFFSGFVAVNGVPNFYDRVAIIAIPIPRGPNPTISVSLDWVTHFILFYVPHPMIGTITLGVSQIKAKNITTPSVTIDDMRPWHFAYPIIKQMFCSVGYELVSPILSSDYGRRILTYILDNTLHEDKTEYTIAPINIGGPTQEYQRDLFIFGEKGVFDIDFTLIYRISDHYADVTYKVDEEGISGVFAWVFDGNIPMHYYGSEILYKPAKGVVTVKMTLNDVVIKAGQTLKVFMTCHRCFGTPFLSMADVDEADPHCSGPVVSYTLMNVKRKAKFFWSDFGKDIFISESNKLIQKDLTNLDYLKAITHILNLKYYTDHANRKVYALQPDDVDLYGEVLEGFFTETPIDIENIDDTYVVTQPDTSVAIHHIKFKDGDLHGYKIPVGGDINDGSTEVSENLLFAPTPLQQYGEGAVAVGNGALHRSKTTGRYHLPLMVELSKDGDPIDTFRPEFGATSFGIIKGKQNNIRLPEFGIDMRILLSYGRRYQNTKDGIQTHVHRNSIVKSGLWAIAAHYHPCLSPIEGVAVTSIDQYEVSPKTLLFKWNQVGYDWLRNYSMNLVEKLHYKWIINKYRNIGIEYLCWLSKNEFAKKTLRESYILSHLGKPLRVIINRIADFRTCKDISTVVNFQIYDKVQEICDLTPPVTDPEVEIRTEDDCSQQNQPQVGIDYVVTTNLITLTLTGLNTNPVVNVLFEYSYDLTEWFVATNTSVISAEFPATNQTVYVRAGVEYEDCPITVTTPIPFTACEYVSNSPFSASIYVKPDGSICTSANITIPEGITYVINSFTIDLGDGPVIYTNGTEICGITGEVTYSLTTTVNECDPTTVVITVPYGETCIDADTVGLECAEGITFIRTGNLPIGVSFDRVWYQLSMDGVNWVGCWTDWCGEDIDLSMSVYKFIRARRVIEFCGTCKDICTPIIYCNYDCPETYEIECVDMTYTVIGNLSGCTIDWEGPFGYTNTGNPITVDVEGMYTATITCDLCTYTVQRLFRRPVTEAPIADNIEI
jgi:hypothetical protein